MISPDEDGQFYGVVRRLCPLAAVAEHRASLRHPPKTPDQYLDTLLVQELPETVAFLRQRRPSL